ncbi:amidohydrolase family protein [Verminephrobacter eiseniae]|uniref:amidohydrolase family protein n=1 Tax=Verminephrobacter eiseniae TaxID=364317 RepID=UPI0010F002E1|nr:amidohydrolase family protein [Verminephrobacter eiseniae]KAB7615099.1 amidohydrolase family protein [Verminephrobacter sp. Larva24]MCW5233257.1 amidohydrolase [Verminephrobacter eiseniae]MCW5295189.1 amidohydrolase [Verminephrobacter eiseniae]MCW8184159.1 amidohydrolase [Verminephrobacter eiseniae]MCW8222668.1 amidohydrolase [Verminephrobacter eiseniae]
MQNLQQIDVLIEHGCIITMDAQRRVLDDGALAVHGQRIVAVGATDALRQRYQAARVLDARRKAVLPGLIDAHAHAGHAMLKTMGGGNGEAWMHACKTIYTSASDENFWEVESHLAALERLKAGVTTGVSLLGGGDSIMRVDDPVYAQRHCAAVAKTGTRSVVAVGPSRPPAPRNYTTYAAHGATVRAVDDDTMYAVCQAIIDACHDSADQRIKIALTLPVYGPAYDPEIAAFEAIYRSQAGQYMALARARGLTFTQDGHRAGTLAFAHRELGLLGRASFMSHAIDLTGEDIALCRETGTSIVHNPSAIMSIRGRCPVPELIDAGVNVAIGSDGAAPDRGYDMFRHMSQCMHYHRRHFRDAGVLPHGKVLEMATIDAARALSMEQDIGSLEAGKKADIILVDLFKPHLMPLNMPVYRITCFANAGDVCTTIVDGNILMEDYRVLSVDETEVLERVTIEAERMLERSGLRHLLDAPPRLWGASHY